MLTVQVECNWVCVPFAIAWSSRMQLAAQVNAISQLEARESQGGTIVVSSVSISVWAGSQEPALPTRAIAMRLGVNTEKLLVMPGLTYNPNTATTQLANEADLISRSTSGMPDARATHQAAAQIHQTQEGDRIYPPESPKARREPAITYELEQSPPPPSLSEHPAAKDRVEDEAFELMTYTQGPSTPVVETKINQDPPELEEDPESKSHPATRPE